MAILSVSGSDAQDSLAAAVNAANSYDEIHIAGTLEVADSIVIDKPLRFVGVGGLPSIVALGLLRGAKGIFATRCDVLVHNIEFRGASALTGNGAGVWQEAGDLALTECVFTNNQNGVMAASGPANSVQVTGCRFIANGSGCGHTHGLYVGSPMASAVVTDSTFERTAVGHHVKSRARATVVDHCYFGANPDSATSCEIDIANGGEASVRRNLLVKGRNAMSRKFISFCAERPLRPGSRIEVTGNIFINHRRNLTAAVVNHSLSASAMLRDNAFEGVAIALVGRGREIGRRQSKVAIAEGA